MRVIAGSARHLLLKTAEGRDIRPTTDRIKETLFNIIQPGIFDCRFLDLYSGSGGIGIEALSRGAAQAVFVERDPKALACIRENLEFTKLEKNGIVMGCETVQALPRLERENRSFDYIFMDPPYGEGEEEKMLRYLSGSSLVDEDTIIIVEADLKTDFSYIGELGFLLKREKKYKTNKHLFLTR